MSSGGYNDISTKKANAVYDELFEWDPMEKSPTTSSEALRESVETKRGARMSEAGGSFSESDGGSERGRSAMTHLWKYVQTCCCRFSLSRHSSFSDNHVTEGSPTKGSQRVPPYFPLCVVLFSIIVVLLAQKPWDDTNDVGIPVDTAKVIFSTENGTAADVVVDLAYVNTDCYECMPRPISLEDCPADVLNGLDDLEGAEYVTKGVQEALVASVNEQTLDRFGANYTTDPYGKHDERHVCASIGAGSLGVAYVQTQYPTDLYASVRRSDSSTLSSGRVRIVTSKAFAEHGTYEVVVSASSRFVTAVVRETKGGSSLGGFAPIVVALVAMACAGLAGRLASVWLPHLRCLMRYVSDLLCVGPSAAQGTSGAAVMYDDGSMMMLAPSPATERRLDGGSLAMGAPWGPPHARNMVDVRVRAPLLSTTTSDTEARQRRDSGALFQSWASDNTIPSNAGKSTHRVGDAGSSDRGLTSDPDSPATTMKRGSKSKKKWRLKSLDTFRGASLAIMIFVNFGGGGYWFFDHSKWNGLTVADLVFPWFMWIMGASMALSFDGLRRKQKTTRARLLYKIAKRSATLFALGLFLNSEGIRDVPLSHYRIPGVLQYFAISYFVCATTVALWEWPADGFSARPAAGRSSIDDDGSLVRLAQKIAGDYLDGRTPVSPLVVDFDDDVDMTGNSSSADGGSGSGGLGKTNRRQKGGVTLLGSSICTALPVSVIADIWVFWGEWLVFGALLTIYFLIQTYLPLENGCPTGYIGPGGLAENAKHFQCTGGAHRRVDEALFGKDRYYHSPTCKSMYLCEAYDPEGALGALTASALTFLGLQAGRILVIYKGRHRAILTRWFVWGVALCSVAAALCGMSKNGGVIPVSKNLWSPSFIFLMSGSGFIVLGVCYLLVDVCRWWSGSPFRQVGMNSILIYCSHEILSDYFPFHWQHNGQHDQALACNVLGASCWVAIAFALHENGVFFKI